MKGLSLGGMKKVAEDESSATFKHKNGHTIKVAISALSPAMRKQLASLPIHAAEGEDIEPQMPQEVAPVASVLPDSNTIADKALVSAGLQPQAPTLVENSPMPEVSLAPVPMPHPEDQAPQTSAPSEPTYPAKDMVEQPVAQPQEKSFEPVVAVPQTPEQQKSDLMGQADAFRMDIENGHIKPKTYSDLFAEKSTLGKIGTIFGLIVGGAGAGLTRQPNLLIEMMNKQIENDLNAQVKSKENAVNYMKLNQQQQLNDAQIENMQKQGVLTLAQADAMRAEMKLKSYSLARMQMNIAAVHSLAQKVQQLPLGSPQRAQAENTLAMMYSALNAENSNIADKAVAASALANFGSQTAGGDNASAEEQFQRQNRMLRMSGNESMAKDREEKHIPGLLQQTSIPVSTEDRSRIEAANVLDHKVNDVLKFAQDHRGSVDPRILAQGKQKAEELAAFYNKTVDTLGMTGGRMEWLEKQIKDNPTSVIQQVLGNNARLKEIRDSNASRRDEIVKKYGIKEYPKSQPVEDVIERVDPKSGRTVIFDAKTKQPLRWK